MFLMSSRGQEFSCQVPHQPSLSSRNVSEQVTFPNVTDVLRALSGRPCITKVTRKLGRDEGRGELQGSIGKKWLTLSHP